MSSSNMGNDQFETINLKDYGSSAWVMTDWDVREFPALEVKMYQTTYSMGDQFDKFLREIPMSTCEDKIAADELKQL